MSLKDWMKKVESAQLNEFATNGQVQIKPASQMPKAPGQQGQNQPGQPLGANNGQQGQGTNTNTQVITQGNKTLGTVNNPQLAQQIKQSIGKGEMTLAGDQLGEAEMMEVAPPGMEDAVLALKKKFPGQEGKAYAIAWSNYNKKNGKKDTKESMMAESKQLNEGSLDEIISNHPHEHKMCQEGWGMDNSLYEALADHYFKEGRIPRSVWHGSAEALKEFVEDCYAKDTMVLGEADIDQTFASSHADMLDEEDMAEGMVDSMKSAFGMNTQQASPVAKKKQGDKLEYDPLKKRFYEEEMMEGVDVIAGLSDILKIASSRQSPPNPKQFAKSVADGAFQLMQNPAAQRMSSYLKDLAADATTIANGTAQYTPAFASQVASVMGPAVRAYQDAGMNEGSKEDFTMNARQADPRLDKYATDPKPSVASQVAGKLGNTLKTGFNKVMNKLHPSDEELRSGPLEETSSLERMLRQSTKESTMYESKKSKKAVEEAVEKTKTGLKHRADAGGYGRKDDEEDEDEDGKKIKKAKKDEPKKGRGRPKKTDNKSGEDKEFDFSVFGVTKGKDIKLKPWDKKKTTTHKIATKADREEVDEAYPSDEAQNRGKPTKKPVTPFGQKKKDAQMESWDRQLMSMLKEDMEMVAPTVIPKQSAQQPAKQPAQQGGAAGGDIMGALKALLQNAGLKGDQSATAATPTPNAAGGDELDGSELQSGVDGPVNDKNSEPGSKDPRNNPISGQVFVPQLAMPRGMGMSVEGDVHTHEIDVEPQNPDEIQITLSKDSDEEVMNNMKDLINRITGGNTRDGEAKLIVPYGDYAQEVGGETARDHQDVKQPNASVGVQGADDLDSIRHLAGTGGGILPSNLEESDMAGTFEEDDSTFGHAVQEGETFGHTTATPGAEQTAVQEDDEMVGTFEEDDSTFGHAVQEDETFGHETQMEDGGDKMNNGNQIDAELATSLMQKLEALLGNMTDDSETADVEVDSEDGIDDEESMEVDDEESMEVVAEKKVDEGQQPCNECGLSESKCECSMTESKRFTNLLKMFEAAKPDFADIDGDGDEKESMKKAAKDKKDSKAKDTTKKLDEWANSPGGQSEDEAFVADMDFMTKVISGGLNNMKKDQTVLPNTRVDTKNESTEVASDGEMKQMKKLAGLK